MKIKILILTILLGSVVTLSAKGKKKESKMYAQIETDKGTIKIELFYEQTPMTVANFVGLAEGDIENKAKAKGVPFYDGLKFHRVISKGNGDAQDFMVQGGDPQGTGMGDPGYKFPDEFVDTLGFDEPYLLAMANSGPGTNGSQFFITVAATTWLNQKHTIFGKVVEGQDVLNTIKQGDVMNKVTIIREGKEAKKFNAAKVFAEVQESLVQAEKDKIKAEMKTFEDYVKKEYPNAQKTASGLHYIVEKEGTGAPAEKGRQVSVHYAGTLADGTEFDNSFKRNQPIDFQLGVGQVIQGWDEGIALMKEGAKYKLIIPYQLAYGANGRPPVIPAKATLIFDTELIKVK
ncbi:MAG: peptidylprolyl isomerase [Chitinophagales bacterium]